MEEVGVPVVFGGGTPSHFSFIIKDSAGRPIKYFEHERGKNAYLAVVKKDLSYFRHYPYQFDKKLGSFTIPDLYFPAEGDYRLVADFFPLNIKEEEVPHAKAFFNFSIGGPVGAKPLGTLERVKFEEIFKVSMWSHPESPTPGEVTLVFEVRIDDRPVTTLEEYLGGFGQLSIFETETLEFFHEVSQKSRNPSSEAVAGQIEFKVKFPASGIYKMFLEFKFKENITITPFLIKVKR